MLNRITVLCLYSMYALRFIDTSIHTVPSYNSCNDVFSMFAGLTIVYALLPTDF